MNPTTPNAPGTAGTTAAAAVLCGTDFSPAAEAAAGVAATLARRLEAPLQLLHAETHVAAPAVTERLEREAARLRTTGGTV